VIVIGNGIRMNGRRRRRRRRRREKLKEKFDYCTAN